MLGIKLKRIILVSSLATITLLAQQMDYNAQIKNKPGVLSDTSIYTSFSAACAAALANNLVLSINRTWTNVPATSCTSVLEFNGGKLQPANGQTVTFKVQSAPLSTICDISLGGHCVINTPDGVVYPQWTGGVADGATDNTAAVREILASIPAGGTIRFVPGSYKLGTEIITNSYTKFDIQQGATWIATGVIVIVANDSSAGNLPSTPINIAAALQGTNQLTVASTTGLVQGRRVIISGGIFTNSGVEEGPLEFNTVLSVDDSTHFSVVTPLAYTYSIVSTTGTAASGSNSLMVASGTGLAQGMFVSGTNIATNTYLLSGSGMSWVLSTPTVGVLSSTAINFSIETGASNPRVFQMPVNYVHDIRITGGGTITADATFNSAYGVPHYTENIEIDHITFKNMGNVLFTGGEVQNFYFHDNLGYGTSTASSGSGWESFNMASMAWPKFIHNTLNFAEPSGGSPLPHTENTIDLEEASHDAWIDSNSIGPIRSNSNSGIQFPAGGFNNHIVNNRLFGVALDVANNSGTGGIFSNGTTFGGSVVTGNILTDISGRGITDFGLNSTLFPNIHTNSNKNSTSTAIVVPNNSATNIYGISQYTNINTLIDANIGGGVGVPSIQPCNGSSSILCQDASTTGTASSGSTALTVASAVGIAIGQTVQGTNISVSPTTIVSNISGTAVTLSQATTGILSVTPITFNENGLGVGGTAAFFGSPTDEQMYVNIQTSGTPIASNKIFVITNANPFNSNLHSCFLAAVNQNSVAPRLTTTQQVAFDNFSASSLTLKAGSTALPSGQTAQWMISCPRP